MHLQFGEMEFGEMKRNTLNWSNFCMLLRRVGLTASAGLSCYFRYKIVIDHHISFTMMRNKNNGNREKEIFIYKTSVQPTNITMTTIN